MPVTQLVCALIEASLNQLIALDGKAITKLVKLQGQSLGVNLSELPVTLQFSFTDKSILVTSNPEQTPDCYISCNVKTLTALKDPSQITRLIKAEALQLEGDIHIAQHFSSLVKELDIDWGEHLSQFVGDIAAHKMIHAAKQTKQKLSELGKNLRNIGSEYAVEELRLAPHPIQLMDYADQVEQLRSDCARLDARVTALTSKGLR